MIHIIIGKGEVGQALHYTLSRVFSCKIHDQVEFEDVICPDPVRAVHICFPWTSQFADEVRRYRIYYQPDLLIIHSTVPVGTCSRLGAVHSPFVGIHPHLEESLQTFRKAVGGDKDGQVAKLFLEAGLRVQTYRSTRTTELMKLMSTTRLALEVEWNNAVLQQCEYHQVPMEAYHQWTVDYNEGYRALGRPEYVRTLLALIGGLPGGHCMFLNLVLLNGCGEHVITEFLMERIRLNAAYREEENPLRGLFPGRGVSATDTELEQGQAPGI